MSASLSAYRADIRLQQGHVREAVALATAAARDAERHGARRALAHAYRVLHAGYQQLGEPEKAVYRGEGARDLEGARRAQGRRDHRDEPRCQCVRRGALGRGRPPVHARPGGSAARRRPCPRRAGRGEPRRAAGQSGGARRGGGGARRRAAPVESVRIRRCCDLRGRADGASPARARIVGERPSRCCNAPSTRPAHWATRSSPSWCRSSSERRSCAQAIPTVRSSCSTAPNGRQATRRWTSRFRSASPAAARSWRSGRYDEAAGDLATALALARRQGLLYEEAQLLQARAELTRLTGQQPDGEELREAQRLLQLLSVAS